MKRNYIEINFEVDVDVNEDEYRLMRDAEMNVDPHPHTLEEINTALKILYPGEKVEIDWRDSRTVWIWPNGLMAQWSEEVNS